MIKRKHIYFLNVCWCGEIVYGNNKCCRGHNIRPHSRKLRNGDKFGKLTIIGYNFNKHKYVCKCDCGYVTTTSTSSLLEGHKQCKYCYYKTRSNPRLPNNLSIKNVIYKEYVYSAKKRNIDFRLSKEEFFSLLEQNCTYCGVVPSSEKYSKNKTIHLLYNGIDRVNSSKGYINDNVVTCCWICNNSKASLLLEDWKLWVSKVYKKIVM